MYSNKMKSFKSKINENISFILIIFFSIFYSNFVYSSQICDSDVIENINKNISAKNYSPIFHYNQERKDIGIFYDFEWNSDKEEIILKRDSKNYPILRFSLFEKNYRQQLYLI